jgi:hypothetical protein
VQQLTMSPFRNPLHVPIQVANRLLERGPVVRALRWVAARAGVREPSIAWTVDEGPWFNNGLMTVDIRGRTIGAEVEHAKVVGGAQVLERTRTTVLATPAHEPLRDSTVGHN